MHSRLPNEGYSGVGLFTDKASARSGSKRLSGKANAVMAATINSNNLFHASPVTLEDAYVKDDAFMAIVQDGELEAHPNFDDLGALVAEINGRRSRAFAATANTSGAEMGSGEQPSQGIRERAYVLA